MTAPEWLTRHDGELRPGVIGGTWFVYFDNAPQYRLSVTPTADKIGCEIMQTGNNRRVPFAAAFPSHEEAVRGALEELRKTLGW